MRAPSAADSAPPKNGHMMYTASWPFMWRASCGTSAELPCRTTDRRRSTTMPSTMSRPGSSSCDGQYTVTRWPMSVSCRAWRAATLPMPLL